MIQIKFVIIPFFHTGKFFFEEISLHVHEAFLICCFSVFYVFYDQYVTIWYDLIGNLSLSFCAVFLVTCILLGFDFHTSFLIILCVFMIITDMFGVMYLWGIELNAVSVVNIIMVRISLKWK